MVYPLGTVTPIAGGWREVITTSGTWSAPTVATHGFTIDGMSIGCWAGAAGGKNGVALGASGGGGGGGSFSLKNLFAPSAGSDHTATVGAGGIANGGAGGDTWFSSTSTVLAKGAAAVGAVQKKVKKSFAVTGTPNAAMSRDLTLRRSYSVAGNPAAAMQKRGVFKRSFTVAGNPGASVSKRMIFGRAYTVAANGAAVMFVRLPQAVINRMEGGVQQVKKVYYYLFGE